MHSTKKEDLKEIRDCKVLTGESVARQHGVVITKMVLQVQRKRGLRTELDIKWWRLHEKGCCKTFREQASEFLHATDETTNWQQISDTVREIGRNVLVLGI